MVKLPYPPLGTTVMGSRTTGFHPRPCTSRQRTEGRAPTKNAVRSLGANRLPSDLSQLIHGQTSPSPPLTEVPLSVPVPKWEFKVQLALAVAFWHPQLIAWWGAWFFWCSLSAVRLFVLAERSTLMRKSILLRGSPSLTLNGQSLSEAGRNPH